MKNDVQIYGGTLLATEDDRTFKALLVPFNEEASSNLGRFEADADSFTFPTDESALTFNVDHDHEETSGNLAAMRVESDGIWSDFKFAKTPEGDKALEEVRSGRRRAVSVEAKKVVIRAGKAIAGHIYGAALVKAGAFPSATLLAAAVDTAEEEPPATEDPEDVVEKFTEEITGEDGKTHKQTTTRTTHVEGTTTTITEKVVIEEPEPPAEEEAPVPAATVPANTLKAKKEISANDVFDMMTSVLKGDDTAGTLLAALTDIKISGGGQLPVGGAAVQPAWLGEVWAKKAYRRRYIPLLGGSGKIVALEEKGFSVATGAEPVKAWAGNKAELPTESGTTSPLTSILQRWGVANDIAREFYDIPAGRPVIEAYIRLLVNSYGRVSDYWLLQQLVTSAGAQVNVAALPAGYSPALGKVIQAIDLVDDTDAEPSFVVVAADVWRDLRYTPKDQIPEYVKFSLNRTDGTADGDVVVMKDKAGKLATGQVLAGGSDVAHINEINGETPIQLDALDIVHGGIDKAVIGYTQYMADYEDGLVLVGNAP